MKMSEVGIQFLKELEGSKSHVYADVAGLMTIGVGHLLSTAERNTGCICLQGNPINYKNGLSSTQIDILLQQDLERFEYAVNGITVLFTQNQFDSLVSFCFNIGIGAFKSSTLYDYILSHDFTQVPMQMRRWNRAGGKVVQGLINRREKEIALWNGGV